MRPITSFIILCLISLFLSCSGTKKAANNLKNSTETAIKPVDTVLTQTVNLNKTAIDTIPKEKPTAITFVHSTEEKFNHQLFDNLLQKNVSSAGKVNYKGFANNRAKLKSYIAALGMNMPNSNWSRNDKLAYWINAYNAMTIDLILRHYPIKSIKDLNKPWDQRFWKLSEKWYNLNEIEHHILRKMDEPRIHFAIVCASYSCPNLKNSAYQATNLDTQLTKVTKDFLSDPEKNSISENSLELSKIFQWFSKDFKQNGSLINFLNQFSEITISEKAKKRYKDYDWSLNE